MKTNPPSLNYNDFGLTALTLQHFLRCALTRLMIVVGLDQRLLDHCISYLINLPGCCQSGKRCRSREITSQGLWCVDLQLKCARKANSNNCFLTETWPHFTRAFTMKVLQALQIRPGRQVSLVHLFYFWYLVLCSIIIQQFL